MLFIPKVENKLESIDHCRTLDCLCTHAVLDPRPHHSLHLVYSMTEILPNFPRCQFIFSYANFKAFGEGPSIPHAQLSSCLKSIVLNCLKLSLHHGIYHKHSSIFPTSIMLSEINQTKNSNISSEI